MADPTDLEPTAALVMLWAHDLYRTGSAGRFYSCLDLSKGERMRRECEEVCPWYAEVILNRKWCIRRLAVEFITNTSAPCQVVIPAAGRAPLAIELLDACGDGIALALEIDIAGMEEKQRLYEQAAPARAEKIRCIPADLADLPGTAAAIAGAGYDPNRPTVVILEGVSYYISPATLAGIVSLFASPDRKNRAIVEYLLPCRLVAEERRTIPHEVWRIINRDCNPGRTVTYSPDEMERTLARAGCDRVVHRSLHGIERARTGTNRYFPDVPDGWIRVACGRL